jgi:uncharacterized protein
MEVSLDLMSFIETSILPKYNSFGKSHGLAHVQRVITSSMVLARRLGADIDMVYTIAAYHDLGMSGPRAIHHITGGKILMATTAAEMVLGRADQNHEEAVEDHRASASHEPRSIYGKIVAEADRDLQPEVVFTRAIEYGVEHYPSSTRRASGSGLPATWKRNTRSSALSSCGFPTLPTSNTSKTVRVLIADKSRLRAAFDKIYPTVAHPDHHD